MVVGGWHVSKARNGFVVVQNVRVTKFIGEDSLSTQGLWGSAKSGLWDKKDCTDQASAHDDGKEPIVPSVMR